MEATVAKTDETQKAQIFSYYIYFPIRVRKNTSRVNIFWSVVHKLYSKRVSQISLHNTYC